MGVRPEVLPKEAAPEIRSRTAPILDQDIIRGIPYGNSSKDVLQLCHLLLALRYWLEKHTSLYSSMRIRNKKNSLAVKNMQICWSPDLKADGSAVTASCVFDQTSVFTGERNNREVLWWFFFGQENSKAIYYIIQFCFEQLQNTRICIHSNVF